MIKIRMARGGRKNKPVFTIVATDSRKPRDGGYLEKLGQYSPNAAEPLKAVQTEAIGAWLKKGAELSDTVRTLFKKHNVKVCK